MVTTTGDNTTDQSETTTPAPPSVLFAWWGPPGFRNWGDNISELIIQGLSGVSPTFARRSLTEFLGFRPQRIHPLRALFDKINVIPLSTPRYFAAGSILDLVRGGDCVWGTGINLPLRSFPQKAKVFAVRGPLTRNNLIELGIECPPIYGDPGLLMPYFCPVSRTDEYKWGVIPNYVDLPRARQLVSTRGTRLIDVRSGIEDVMRETARCAYIASSSLHGIVLAESLGIPAVFVQFSDNVIGGTLKFDDYYLSTNRAPVVPLDWSHTMSLSEGLGLASNIPAPTIDLDRLVQACPFNFLGIRGVKDIVPICDRTT